MSRIAPLGYIALLTLVATGALAAATPDPHTVVVDDTAFWGRMPLKDQITDAAEQRVPWLFNNTALKLLAMTNVEADVAVPAAGDYWVYVRGNAPKPNASFRIALGTTTVSESITPTAEYGWHRVGPFALPQGTTQLRVTRIVTAPTIDVIALSTRADLTADDLKSLQGTPEARLVREYRIPESVSVNFGDANNDGKIDLLVTGAGFSTTIVDHDGETLWSYEPTPDANSPARSTDDINGLIWDLDGDGAAEVIHWQMVDGVESIAVAEGSTGKVLRSIPWPNVNRDGRRAYNNHRLAIARFGPGPKDSSLVVYSDPGGGSRIDVFDPQLKPRWSRVEQKKKDHLGHNPYLVDVDRDGVDELLVSAMLLAADGRVIWQRYDVFNDNHDHADQQQVTDLDGDGRPELVCGWSDVGAVAVNALTGELRWWREAEHTQRIRAGHFLDGVPGPQVVAGQRLYGNRAFEPYLFAQVKWFSPMGDPVGLWPQYPLNCNPKFARADWRGDGGEHLFWFKFHLNRQGTGEFYFPEEVYTAFDFQGDRAEEVITREGTTLKVWGSAKADASNPKFGRDPEYLRTRVVNVEH